MNKLGFGFLRLPEVKDAPEKTYDFNLLNQMVDYYMANGGKYFDTAYTYLNGISEEAIKECVVNRYPRDKFVLANKLPGYKAKSREDCVAFFDEQLKRCNVDFFDVYMLHWLNKENYEIAKKYDEFGFIRKLKEEGKARSIGFSFHDTAAVLDTILEEHDEIDYVQLQINYLDWNSPSIQGRECYEVAKNHGKKSNRYGACKRRQSFSSAGGSGKSAAGYRSCAESISSRNQICSELERSGICPQRNEHYGAGCGQYERCRTYENGGDGDAGEGGGCYKQVY